MLTVKSTFKLLDVINKHFNNQEDSRTFVSEIEEIMDNKVDLKMNDFTTKKDLADLKGVLKTEIADLKTELKTDIADLRTELKTDIADLRTELKTDIAELRTEFKTEIVELKTEFKTEIGFLRADFNKLDAGINLNLANSAIVLERSQKEQIKWLVGAMVAIISLAVAIIKLF